MFGPNCQCCSHLITVPSIKTQLASCHSGPIVFCDAAVGPSEPGQDFNLKIRKKPHPLFVTELIIGNTFQFVSVTVLQTHILTVSFFLVK